MICSGWKDLHLQLHLELQVHLQLHLQLQCSTSTDIMIEKTFKGLSSAPASTQPPLSKTCQIKTVRMRMKKKMKKTWWTFKCVISFFKEGSRFACCALLYYSIPHITDKDRSVGDHLALGNEYNQWFKIMTMMTMRIMVMMMRMMLMMMMMMRPLPTDSTLAAGHQARRRRPEAFLPNLLLLLLLLLLVLPSSFLWSSLRLLEYWVPNFKVWLGPF